MAKPPPAAADAPVLDDTVEVPAEGDAAPRRSWRERLRLPKIALRMPAFVARLPLPRIALPKKTLILIGVSAFAVAGAGAAAYAFWPKEPEWPRTPVVAKKKKGKRMAAAKPAASAASAATLADATAAASASAASAVAAGLPASGPEEGMDRLRRRLGEVMGAGSTLKEGAPGELQLTARAGSAPSGERGRAATGTPAGTDVAATHAAAHAPREAAATTAAHTPRAASRAGAHDDELGGAHAPAMQGHVSWSYAGPSGPESWGRLNPEFAKCATGKRQSPIDIRDGIQVQLDPVQFEYQPSRFAVIDNGHTVQVNVAPGNFIEVGGRRFELQQFHFHRPSEERIDGRQFDMVAHLVHKDAQGRLAVVAVLLERGSAQAVVQSVWNNLPLEKGEEQPAQSSLDLAQLLPAERSYFTYMGSLTTPPCSEGVLWMVMKRPVPISPEQIGVFARLYPMNARPLQSASGRMIKESSTP
jgi:carbonic anhydrase